MNPDVKTDDWVVLKAKQDMKASQPFLLLINEECLAQLEAQEFRLWYGVRKAKIKFFLNEPPDNFWRRRMMPRPASILPNVVQINLKRRRVASDNLLVIPREEDIDVGIIQEAWTSDSTVMGLNTLHGSTTHYI